jgi:hypothetical protein
MAPPTITDIVSIWITSLGPCIPLEKIEYMKNIDFKTFSKTQVIAFILLPSGVQVLVKITQTPME